MKLSALLSISLLSLSIHNNAIAEDWKDATPPQSVQVGGMVGLGLVGNQAGMSLIAQAAKRVIDRGFVPDLNDSVWFEVQAGWILFIPSGNPFGYSAHLRWDFIKDDQWSLYGLAGFGGLTNTGAALFFPRTAIGAAMSLTSKSPMQLRFELSQSWTATGISWLF
ncbi:MAG: hypothetical protein KA715_09815 [Xanthomonadaceae bacterium]|nr:hypothetical protein [Xanthomonadaceae bacterium]